MGSAIVLQMRTLDALVHLAWLGPRIFRGKRPREGPISNKNLGRRAEKPHLGHVGWKERGNLRGVAPNGLQSPCNVCNGVFSEQESFFVQRLSGHFSRTLSNDFFGPFPLGMTAYL